MWYSQRHQRQQQPYKKRRGLLRSYFYNLKQRRCQPLQEFQRLRLQLQQQKLKSPLLEQPKNKCLLLYMPVGLER
jgi:hypothetical protein